MNVSTTLRTLMITTALALPCAAIAVPPAHAPAHGWRRKHDPTYAGYSTGRWEGDTLVVETVALNTKSFIDGSSPHSGKMTVHERIRLLEPGILEDRIRVDDPEALTEPWEVVRTYRKATYPDDELREFACAEGLRSSPE